MTVPTIPEFFKGKQIFITGGTGFIGKVLIEKLLRCCPELKSIVLLVRQKKGQMISERVTELLSNPLFEVLKTTNPEVLNKLRAVNGDVTQLELGLNEEDKKIVLESNVVFHVAASVRFDDPLKKAILMNTRGTKELMDLMLQMPNLIIGTHVSTTYCNTDKDTIEEKVYRDHGDWREAIKIAENIEDEYKIDCLTPHIKGTMRNTYIYTKHLAENVVEDYSDRLPLVLYRPGIVVSMWKDPVPGWVDNMNGPVGLNLAVGKGLLRSVIMRDDLLVDNFPVDVVVKGIITSTWTKGINPKTSEKLPVYNCSTQGNYNITHRQYYEKSLLMLEKMPFNKSLRYPFCKFTTNEVKFKIEFFIYTFLPAFLMDTYNKFAGKKQFLQKIARKAYLAMLSLSFFTLRNWDFKCEKNWALNDLIIESDQKEFHFSVKDFDLTSYIVKAREGTSKYLLKEEIHLPSAIESYKRLMIVHYGLKAFKYCSLFYIVFFTNVCKSVLSVLM